MTRFVGLDVSQKITAICIVDNAGRRLWRGQCPTVPEQISVLVRRHGGDDARIGIETGAMTPWLVHELRNLGLEVVCLDARHARAALEMQINKTDQNDAEGLAQIVRTGWYRSVHVKSFDNHRARALLGARTQLIGMTTRLSNHIRGLRKSITFDNDTAFAQHGLLQSMRAMATWFCDAYASWQKGGVENANGRLRRWLPRHIDIDRLSD